MNFLDFKNAKDLLNQTGWTVEQALQTVEQELSKLKKDTKER